MTAGPGPRVAANLELLRPIAQEIIVAVDDRADPDVLADLGAVADRVITYPYAEPVDRPLPWLFSECRGDWMLTIDDDEVPSVELLDILPGLLADERIIHYSISRRWVYPDTSTYLDDEPWQPDYQLRLFRTDPRMMGFSDEFHRPIVSRGPGRYVTAPLWHLDTVLRSKEERLAKAHRYEQLRPGLRAAGRALNYAFYVPESAPDARLEPLPHEERTLIELVLRARRPEGASRTTVETVSRERIDAHWPSHRFEQSGELRLTSDVRPFFTSEERAVAVVVRNTGSAPWEWGRARLPTIRCASWWDDENRETAIWTPLPSPVAPFESTIATFHVRAPDEPGVHRLQLGLVHEDVRWLDARLESVVQVKPRRRIAFLDTGAETIRATLAEDPDVEPVVFALAPRSDPTRYPETALPYAQLTGDAPAHQLAFSATFLARAGRLLLAARWGGPLPRDGRAFLDALAACERLVVGPAQPESLRRERWTRAVAILAARLLHVPVIRSS